MRCKPTEFSAPSAGTRTALGVAACWGVLLGSTGTQAQEIRERVEVAYTAETVRVDGSDREWQHVAPLRLERRSQLIATQKVQWGGPKDASAQIRLLYDENHLYLFARLVDEHPMVQQPNETFESGDVLEVFFDCKLEDQAEDSKFDEDDLQLMLLPHAKDRSWAVIDRQARDARGGTHAKGVDRGFTGIEVARAPFAGGVVIEASIPLHNLPQLQPATREIGFNIAFGDKDPGRDTYHYLAWAGKEPPASSPANFGRLVFAGPPVLEPRPQRGSHLSRTLAGWLPFVMPALSVLLMLFLARFSYRGPLARRPRLRRVVGAAAALLVVLGIMLPEVLVSVRVRGQRQRSEDIANWISTAVRRMEAGSLGVLQGAGRDEPLLQLLVGGTVRRPVDHQFVSLAELEPARMRRVPLRFESAGISIHPYGIPLTGEPKRFQIGRAPRGNRLTFVVSDVVEQQLVLFHGGPRLRLELGGTADANSLTLSFRDVLPESRGAERTRFYGEVTLANDTTEVAIEVVEGNDVRLEGLSRVAAASGAPRPVFLRTVSRLGVGVPTDLYGPHPRSAAIVVAPGTNWRAQLSRPLAGVDKVWLLLEAVDSPEFRATTDGAAVGRVMFGPKPDNGASGNFDLRHQIEVFAGDKHSNPELQRLGEPQHAQIAYEWEEHDGTTHMTPGIARSFESPTAIRELTIVNTGTYSFVLRSIVFAKPKPVVLRRPETSPLVTAGRPGEVRLRDDVLERLRGATFFLFRDGQLSASSRPQGAPSLALPSEVGDAVTADGLAQARDLLLEGPGSFETYLPLTGEGWGDAVLGVVVEDQGLADFERRLQLVELLLVSIGVPWLLVFLLETLAPVGTIRLQLTGTVAFATVVPLVLLSLFLVNLLERDQREEDRADLLRDLRLAAARIDEARSSLDAEARASAKQFAEEPRVRRVAASPMSGREPEVRRLLRELLALGRPEGWSRESFVAIEIPHPDEEGRVVRVLDRDESLLIGETPLGPESSLYLRWGRVFVGARGDFEEPVSEFTVRSARGRVIDDAWLSTWISRGILGLYDLDGYPLAIGYANLDIDTRDTFRRRQSLPGGMLEKRPLVERLRESSGPLVGRIRGEEADWLGAFSLLHDRDGAPIALLGMIDRPTEATLPLFFGAVGVRPFFTAVVGLLLVLVTFLTLTLTERVSQPISNLEGLAYRLSKGDLDVEVAPLPGRTEVANLNRAFGKMALELKQRIRQQEQMNSAMARLTAELELGGVVDEARRILAEASGARDVVLVLHDRETTEVAAFGAAGKLERLSRQDDLVSLLFGAQGACSLLLPVEGQEDWAPLGSARSCLVLPMRRLEQRAGAALLVFDGHEGGNLDFSFLGGLLQQIVSAIETARLYGLAIEDASTGLYVRRYFRGRVAQEVDRSQRSGDQLTVIRLEIQGELQAAWGDTYFEAVLRRLGTELLRELPAHAIAGRVGLAAFEVLQPGVAREEARRLGSRLRGVLAGVLEGAGGDVHYQVGLGVACFPEDAGSTAFLVRALDQRVSAAGFESDREPDGGVVKRGRAVFGSRSMLELLEDLDRAAATDMTLLIEGETGVGKEVLVDLCHRRSRRSHGPLVKINCAAIPAALLETELFGHEKGAFTGAAQRKRGVFEQAHGGALFLDEVGEMPLEVQAKLLRVLQDRVFTRVGGERPIEVDVRLIAATHRDLRAMIPERRFREDLFYRLQGVTLRIPPLRERKEEIPELAERFRLEAGAKAPEFSAGALDAMHRYHWPGNVRELENVVKRAVVFAEGRFIEPEDLDLGPDAPPAFPEQARPADLQSLVVVPAKPPPAPPDADARWQAVRAWFAERSKEARAAGLTPRQYRSLTGVSRRTASRDLAAWVAAGRLASRGQKRGARYVLALRGAEIETA